MSREDDFENQYLGRFPVNPIREDDGWVLLGEIIKLGRADKSYRAELKQLKPYLEQFPALRLRIRELVDSLSVRVTPK